MTMQKVEAAPSASDWEAGAREMRFLAKLKAGAWLCTPYAGGSHEVHLALQRLTVDISDAIAAIPLPRRP